MAKKVISNNGKKQTFFNKYVIGDSTTCPECKRPFKEPEVKRIQEIGTISCLKCGARLSIK